MASLGVSDQITETWRLCYVYTDSFIAAFTSDRLHWRVPRAVSDIASRGTL